MQSLRNRLRELEQAEQQAGQRSVNGSRSTNPGAQNESATEPAEGACIDWAAMMNHDGDNGTSGLDLLELGSPASTSPENHCAPSQHDSLASAMPANTTTPLPGARVYGSPSASSTRLEPSSVERLMGPTNRLGTLSQSASIVPHPCDTTTIVFSTRRSDLSCSDDMPMNSSLSTSPASIACIPSFTSPRS